MLKYILRRLVYVVGVFFVISIIMFSIFKAIPGDPALTILEGNRAGMDPKVYQMMYEQAREKLGLDDPIHIQYFKWIGRMITGNMGYSAFYRTDVTKVIKSPLMNTAMLNMANLVLCFTIAISLGILAALKRGTAIDGFVQLITVIGNSLPSFIMAILLVLTFSVKFNLLPISGMGTPDLKGTSMELAFDKIRYMTLPLATLTLSSLGGLTRYVRAGMIEALSMDCIRTARAKGLVEKSVIFSHAFRNALIPIITVTATWFINIFGGSVAIERMFVWNGMGKIMIDALSNQDYAVALAIQMFFAIMALVGNLVVDIVFGLADPRIKFE